MIIPSNVPTSLGIARAFSLLSGPGTAAEALEALELYRR